VGIRDFIHCLEEHQNRLKRSQSLSDKEREETLLESVLGNRRVNLPEEHAVRFAQDVFLYLRDQEQKVKEALREPASRDAAEG
jgi:phenylalanyl-tRNA synthetase alpha subunit